MGAEPWVPDRVDMTSAMARGAYRGPGSGKWEMGEHVTSVLPYIILATFLMFIIVLVPKPMAVSLFYLSFPILDTVPTCHF